MTNSTEARRAGVNTILSIALEAVELGEKATPGPWEPSVFTRMGCRVSAKQGPLTVTPAIAQGTDDAALIAHAGTNYAALARAYVALRERLFNLVCAVDDEESGDGVSQYLLAECELSLVALTKENTDAG